MGNKGRKLPDDAADNWSSYDNSIDSIISDPLGPSNLKRMQQLEEEYAAQSAELHLLREKYGLTGDDDSREALFTEELENEVARTREWAYTSDEAEQIFRQDILRSMGKGTDEEDSADVWAKKQRNRLQREQDWYDPPKKSED